MKALTELSIAYIDLVVVALIAFGIFQGRKRGISGELLDVVKWIGIVVVGGMGYQPLTRMLGSYVPEMSHLTGYILVYCGVILLFMLVFGSLKHTFGEKIAAGDTFGAAEYYLGMVAGAVRFCCIIVATMALIHAREYTRVEVQAREKQQEDNFGSIRFFRLYSLQADIFQSSLTGRTLEQIAPSLLIKATGPNEGVNAAPSATASKLQNRRLNEVLDR